MNPIRRLDARAPDFFATLDVLLAFEPSADKRIDRVVTEILHAVRERGDAAVLEYTRRFDGLDALSAANLEVPQSELRAALDGLSKEQREALELAVERVHFYHERQMGESWTYTEVDGTVLGQKVTPIDRVGLYVPGGRAAYPSSVVMNAVPAKVAGVGELIMTAPAPMGEKNQLMLAAAAITGVDRVFTVGGAQAIAALAYGTQTIPRVDKIVGPGNAFVAEAKRRVFGTVGIDMVAGPSEVLIISDGSGQADWVAMDLFAQAEHDDLAQSILLCTDAAFIDAVHAAIDRLLPEMPRAETIGRSLTGRGALIYVESLEQACEIANRIAPEHLELALDRAEDWVNKIHHAGAIFVGHWAVEALGDYCAGPNHVLPTMRSARFSSPLGVYDFQKRSSIVQISRDGAQKLALAAAVLADGEGLQAHARSARMRLESPGGC
ncbi:MAG: histidinol dehydrogenase [Betaproteobacteria bacterium]|nr:histidinol dehydrogenase [Betaproteobacteria bacterium]